MKLPIPFSRLAGLAAGSMIMGSALLSANGQGSVNINAGGVYNWAIGSASNVGDPVSISIDGFNPYACLLVAGNGSSSLASGYNSQNAINVTIDGQTTTFQGFGMTVNTHALDIGGNDVYSDSLGITWGTGGNGIVLCDSYGTVANSSLSSAVTLLNDGLTALLPYTGEASIDAGMGTLYAGQGDIASFKTTPVATPELAIKLSGGNAVVSYPTNTIGFQLQSSPYLGANANWKAVTNAPVLIGTNNTITLPIVPGSQFFRLGPTN